jgi:hypothetical protein
LPCGGSTEVVTAAEGKGLHPDRRPGVLLPAVLERLGWASDQFRGDPSRGTRIRPEPVDLLYAQAMRARTSLAAAGIAAALAVGLIGCSSTAPSESDVEVTEPTAAAPTASEISTDPATGDLITGSGYSFNAPAGWTAPPDAAARADVYLINPEPDESDFIDTMSVLFGPENGDTPDEIEVNGVAYLEQVVGATEVQVGPRVLVAGSEALHFSALLTSSGISYWTEQYLVTSAGIVFTVTFSFGEAVPQPDRESLAQSVLATWVWN